MKNTIQNLNPNNPDYYLPLDITLVVRNEKAQCIGQTDTLLTSTSQLVFTRKLLTCFPTNTGRDSTFRTFEVKNVCDLLIMNKFKGVYQDNPGDSLVIEFFPAKLDPGNQDYEYSCDEFQPMVGVNLRENNDSIGFFGFTNTAILDKYWIQTKSGADRSIQGSS